VARYSLELLDGFVDAAVLASPLEQRAALDWIERELRVTDADEPDRLAHLLGLRARLREAGSPDN
jgi:hypothetical protein